MLTHMLLAILLASPAFGQSYERVDVNAQGQPADRSSYAGGISDDGRFVAFLSSATNLSGVGTPFANDVFLRDRVLGTVQRISSSPVYLEQPRYCLISGDGSKVAFARGIGTATQTPPRSYVHDVSSGTTTEVGIAPLKSVQIGGLSFDGRYAVVSAATVTDPTIQVYRIEVATGTTVLVSADGNGTPVGGEASTIDYSGTRVAFQSISAALVPNDTNGFRDVFVYDFTAQTMIRVNVSSSGAEANSSTASSMISGNGLCVVMFSHATNLAVGDTNNSGDVYLRDLQTGVTSLESLSNAQVVLPNGAYFGAISSDGSAISMQTDVPFPSNASVFVHDRLNGALIQAAPDNTYPYYPAPGALTGDGREMLLQTNQTVLGLPHEDQYGVFVVKLGPRCSTSGYCSSLPNSTGQSATIGAQGEASLSFNTLVIAGIGMPSTATAMVVSGTLAIDPGVPFGNGLLCVGGGLIRHGVQIASGGVILDHQDVNALEYANVHPGDTRNYQIYYRDNAAGGALFNTTDGVAVTFCW